MMMVIPLLKFLLPLLYHSKHPPSLPKHQDQQQTQNLHTVLQHQQQNNKMSSANPTKIHKIDTPKIIPTDDCDPFDNAALVVTVATKNSSESACADWHKCWFEFPTEIEQEIKKKKK